MGGESRVGTVPDTTSFNPEKRKNNNTIAIGYHTTAPWIGLLYQYSYSNRRTTTLDYTVKRMPLKTEAPVFQQTYGYDAHGGRVYKKSGSRTNSYFEDHGTGNILSEIPSIGTPTYYVYLGNTLVVVEIRILPNRHRAGFVDEKKNAVRLYGG